MRFRPGAGSGPNHEDGSSFRRPGPKDHGLCSAFAPKRGSGGLEIAVSTLGAPRGGGPTIPIQFVFHDAGASVPHNSEPTG
jgi:hypothetical protein